MRLLTCSLIATTVFASSLSASADDWETQRQQAVAKGVQFLKSSQADDGSFSAEAGPAVTALVATSLLRSGYDASDPLVAKAIDYVMDFQQDDGGIYAPDSRYKNYETCIAILCLSEANEGGKYDGTLAKADAFVKGIQWDDDEGHDIDSPAHGGGRLRESFASRSVEYLVLDRGAQSDRQRARRPGNAEGAAIRVAVPEPGDRIQRHRICCEGQRRRFLLHARPPAARARRARPTTAGCGATPR